MGAKGAKFSNLGKNGVLTGYCKANRVLTGHYYCLKTVLLLTNLFSIKIWVNNYETNFHVSWIELRSK